MNAIKKILPVLFLAISMAASAQQGQFLYLWGGPQYTAMANYNDFNTYTNNEINQEATYRFGGGFDYVYNFTPFYGIHTGLAYSQQGQKYSGEVLSYYKAGTTDTSKFNSHIYTNYVRLPIMFRFNALSEDEYRMSMSLFMGFYLAYLANVQEVYTSPAPPDSVSGKYPDFKFESLYHRMDFGIGAGAQVNIRLTKTFGIGFGVRWDRSMIDIEKKDPAIPKDAPVEWYYPVSVVKNVRPSVDDFATRASTRNNVVNLYLTAYFRIGSAGPEKKNPTE